MRGGQGTSGLPISQWWPNGSTMRPSRQPCSSATGVDRASRPRRPRARTAASGSSTVSSSLTVPPPSDSGLKFCVLGRLVGDPERRVADRELRDDGLVLVGAADAVDLDRAEGGLVERDRRAAAAHRELRRHGGRSSGPPAVSPAAPRGGCRTGRGRRGGGRRRSPRRPPARVPPRRAARAPRRGRRRRAPGAPCARARTAPRRRRAAPARRRRTRRRRGARIASGFGSSGMPSRSP